MNQNLREGFSSDVHPFETDFKGRLFVVDVSINWPSCRNWQTKVLVSWKVTQRVYFVRKVLRQNSYSRKKHRFGRLSTAL